MTAKIRWMELESDEWYGCLPLKRAVAVPMTLHGIDRPKSRFVGGFRASPPDFEQLGAKGSDQEDSGHPQKTPERWRLFSEDSSDGVERVWQEQLMPTLRWLRVNGQRFHCFGVKPGIDAKKYRTGGQKMAAEGMIGHLLGFLP